MTEYNFDEIEEIEKEIDINARSIDLNLKNRELKYQLDGKDFVGSIYCVVELENRHTALLEYWEQK